jgi:serine/threonine-protein kinase
MASPCIPENALVELADGLLPAERQRALMEHVDGCTRCRAALAAVARSEMGSRGPAGPVSTVARTPARERETATTRVDTSCEVTAPRASGLPADFLRDYLRKDAPARERTIARFVARLMLALLPLILVAGLLGAPRHALGGAIVIVFVLSYELCILGLLDRGWYHPLLPLASSLVEISVVCAIQILVGARTLGGVAYHAFPASTLLGALVVFSALRADPRVCMAVGSVAAVEVLVAGAIGPPIANGPDDPPAWAAQIVRAVFCFAAGCTGAVLARDLIRRAETALREVRAQDLFGKYILHEPLGRGGMGEVHRATYCPEGGFLRTVAVKRLRSDLVHERQFFDAFREEVRLGASLVHPNIVQMLDCGRLRGTLVVAMEFVDGAPLSHVIKMSGPLAVAAVAYLGVEVAAALAYLHGKRANDGEPLGLVHCDLNPPNVLVSRIGDVKLADFGVARAGARAGETESFAGKVRYAAPEQLLGDPLDGRADLYALGLTLHEALTGRPPIGAGRTAIDAEIEPPSRQRPDVPAALDALVMQLLARAPRDRPADASVVRARLIALEGEACPYPRGEELLARAVEASRAVPSAAPAAATN